DFHFDKDGSAPSPDCSSSQSTRTRMIGHKEEFARFASTAVWTVLGYLSLFADKKPHLPLVEWMQVPTRFFFWSDLARY
ncbi:unnamed protein product, partial [Urochloa humidicola]